MDRARLALALHKLPSELDAMPLVDVADLLEVIRTDNNLNQLEAHKARSRGRRRR